MKERQERNAGQKAQVTQVDADICCVRTRTYSNNTRACPAWGYPRRYICKENRGITEEYNTVFTPFIQTFFFLFLQSEVFRGSEPVVFDLGARRCHRRAQ